ncbi:MAG: hypothetical protein KC561_05455, partial [Myxococcales bacterium]|nr:hypothetical protein [Myxococcales bacterium]
YYEQLQDEAPFVAQAPRAGTITSIPTLDPWGIESGGATGPEQTEVVLFELDGEPIRFNAEAGIPFGRITEVYKKEGESVDAGEAILKVAGDGGAMSPKTRSVQDMKVTVKSFFTEDVLIALHGCSTGWGDDSLAENMYSMLSGALGPKSTPEVYSHTTNGAPTRDARHSWRVFSNESPDGATPTRVRPEAVKGLK